MAYAIIAENRPGGGGEIRIIGNWEEQNIILPGSGRHVLPGVYETAEEAEAALAWYLDEDEED